MISWILNTRNNRPIGLDIGHHNIRMIQMCVNDDNVRVFAAQSTQIPTDIKDVPQKKGQFLISAIGEMLNKGRFSGREVVSCLSNAHLKITSFRVSEKKDEEIEQALKREAQQRFGLDPQTDTIEHMVAGSVQQGDTMKRELIMFAAEQKAINNHIQLLEEAGLRPVAIDVTPCALFRCYSRLLRRQEDKEETIVFVDVGSRFTTVVFGRGKEISFIKQIPVGGEKFNREIASKLGISVDEAQMLRHKLQVKKTKEKIEVRKEQNNTRDDNPIDPSSRQAIVDAIGSVAEELAREISLCFIYYSVTFRGKRVGRVIFSGGEARENILLSILRRQLSVDIEVAQPLRGFDIVDNQLDYTDGNSLCEWAVVTGTGLKGIAPGFLGMENREKAYERN